MSIENIRNIKKAHEEKKPRTKLINSKSEKRTQEEKEYLKKREVFLRKHPVCEAKVECKGDRATTVHHSRGRNGSNYLDVNTWVASCFKCHRWIELNPRHSKKLGLSNSRLKKNG